MPSTLSGRHSPAGQPGPFDCREIGCRREPAEGARIFLVHADPGARGLPDLVREAVVVGVEVRDEDRRDLADLVPGFPDARHQSVPRLVARPSGVDQHRPAGAFKEIGEHVPQRAVRERRGHGPHTGPYLLHRREHPITPSLLLRRPGDRDRLVPHRRTVFNGH